jgi:hypothetical protein
VLNCYLGMLWWKTRSGKGGEDELFYRDLHSTSSRTSKSIGCPKDTPVMSDSVLAGRMCCSGKF